MKWTIVLESDDMFELGNVSGAKAHEDGKFIEIRLLSKRKESVVILDTRSIRFFKAVENTPLWLEDKPYVVGTAIGGDMQFMRKVPEREVLDKYRINVCEYLEIQDELMKALSFGYCSWCV